MVSEESYRPSRRRAAYELEESVIVRPDLPGEVVVLASEDELLDRLAAELVLHAENCVRQFGDFHVALSGGPTFERLYERLMYDPDCRRLPWRRTHLWFVEERCVPFDHDDSSFRMISEIIGDHADIPQEQFHAIFAESADADRLYEASIREALAWREKGQDRLDYVLMTIGEDACLAAQHPAAERLTDTPRLVDRATRRGWPMDDRVSMTLPFLQAARFIAILVTGAEKADLVRRMTKPEDEEDRSSLARLTPINGELRWYLDAAACGEGD
jgi:6-phosphogluconolactonase